MVFEVGRNSASNLCATKILFSVICYELICKVALAARIINFGGWVLSTGRFYIAKA